MRMTMIVLVFLKCVLSDRNVLLELLDIDHLILLVHLREIRLDGVYFNRFAGLVLECFGLRELLVDACSHLFGIHELTLRALSVVEIGEAVASLAPRHAFFEIIHQLAHVV